MNHRTQLAPSLFALLCVFSGGSNAQSDARSEVKGRISGLISQAKKFTINRTDYYAIVRAPYSNGQESMDVFRKSGSTYIKLFGVPVDWNGPPPEQVRLLDLNRDRKVELFYKMQSCGAANCFDSFNLYDSATGLTYEGPVEGNEVEYSKDLMRDVNAPFLDYFTSQLKPLPVANSATDVLGAGAWYLAHAAFSNKQSLRTVIKPKYAPLSACPVEASTTASSVIIGTTKFVSEFKGNVLGIDYKKKTCFLVLMPKDSYAWIGTLKSKNGILIMLDRNDGSVFGKFNPKTFELSR